MGYNKEQQQKYLQLRRSKAKSYLGEECRYCGKDDTLEFDHIDKSTKEYEISVGIAQHIAWDKLVIELDKCQLLCHDCHKEKSDKEQSVEHGGGLSGKKNCPCLLCKVKKAEYMREYSRTHIRKRDRK